MKHNLGLWSGTELQRVQDVKLEDATFAKLYKQLLQLITPHSSLECHLSDVKVRPPLEQNEDPNNNELSNIEEMCSWESVEGGWEWRRWKASWQSGV